MCFQHVYAQQYNLDEEKSSIRFTIEHLGILDVNGSFEAFSISLTQLDNSYGLWAVIQTSTVNTGSESRDETIRGKQYLNTADFPTITFTGLATPLKTEWMVSGSLTIRGVSRSIKLKLIVQPNQPTLHLNGDIILSRKNFKLDFGAMDTMIGDKIKCHLNFHLHTSK